MDFISLEMGLGFLTVFMAPVIYILVKEKSKKKKLNTSIDKICADNTIEKSDTASIAHHVFILDRTNKKLLDYNKKQDDFHIVDLGKYGSCSLQKSGSRNQQRKTVLHAISIVFDTRGHGAHRQITLYDDNYENPLEAEAILYETESLVRLINKVM